MLTADWIEWKGGKRPVPSGATVDVKYRDGLVLENQSAADRAWRHSPINAQFDIIAYRVVQHADR